MGEAERRFSAVNKFRTSVAESLLLLRLSVMILQVSPSLLNLSRDRCECGSEFICGDFSCGESTPQQGTPRSEVHVQAISYNVDELVEWLAGFWVTALNVGGTNGNQVCVLQADGLGNVYACGYFTRGTNGPNGPVDFNPRGANTIRLTSHGLEDAFLAKYDTNGICLWANGWGGATNDSAWGVALDPYGYVYAVGNFYSQPCNFNPGAGTYNLSAVTAGSSSLYFSKFSANTGKFIMARACGGSSDVQSLASCVADADNNLYMGGGVSRVMPISGRSAVAL